jgi:hypothetical protein
MARRSERQAALEVVGAYHEAELTVLLGRATEAVDRFRSGESDAFETDAELFQYGRAAKESWKFCSIGLPPPRQPVRLHERLPHH